MPLNLGLVRVRGNDQNGLLFGFRGGQKGGPCWITKASVEDLPSEFCCLANMAYLVMLGA
jgi:hypothetical protein